MVSCLNTLTTRKKALPLGSTPKDQNQQGRPPWEGASQDGLLPQRRWEGNPADESELPWVPVSTPTIGRAREQRKSATAADDAEWEPPSETSTHGRSKVSPATDVWKLALKADSSRQRPSLLTGEPPLKGFSGDGEIEHGCHEHRQDSEDTLAWKPVSKQPVGSPKVRRHSKTPADAAVWEPSEKASKPTQQGRAAPVVAGIGETGDNPTSPGCPFCTAIAVSAEHEGTGNAGFAADSIPVALPLGCLLSAGSREGTEVQWSQAVRGAVACLEGSSSLRAGVPTASGASVLHGRQLELALHSLELLSHASRRGPTLAEEAVRLGAVALLLGMLRSDCPCLVEHACSTLLQLSDHEGLRGPMSCSAPNLVLVLLHVLECGSDTAKASSASALGRLCLLPGAGESMVDAGALPLLLRLLQHGNGAAKKDAAGCLLRLAVVPECVGPIAQSGVIYIFCQLEHDFHCFLDEEASGVFELLAHKSVGRKALVAQGAVPTLAKILERQPGQAARGHALSALVALVSHNHLLKDSILETGVNVTVDSFTRNDHGATRTKAATLMSFLYG